MKILVNVARVLVGLLFIISGLVKANDPLGLSYKMQEFFEIWNGELSSSNLFFKLPLIQFFNFLHEHSLALSVIMITLEIVAGIALLVGWKRRFVLNMLSILIIFFTFLTAYAFLSGKFKNCGCFGDCLPITPLTSFLKDVALLLLIIFLIVKQRFLQPLSSKTVRSAVVAASLILSIGFQWYVLNYLPVVDCLPFKEGNSITEQMKVPTGSLPDSFAIRFVYQKGGKEYEFSPSELPADLGTYKFVDRVDKLVRKGNAEAPIKGFALIDNNGTDVSYMVLHDSACLLLFCEDFSKPVDGWMDDFKKVYTAAVAKNIPVYVATAASLQLATKVFSSNGLPELPVYTCDNTVVRTAARTNPTLFLLKKSKVEKKFSFREIDKAGAELEKL